MLPNMMLTSDQWHTYINNSTKYHATKIIHPAGWDIRNFQFEWYEEKVSREVYDERLSRSKIEVREKSKLKREGIKEYGEYGKPTV